MIANALPLIFNCGPIMIISSTFNQINVVVKSGHIYAMKLETHKKRADLLSLEECSI